ncbi:pyrroline-5-carboxylate reductase [Pelagicoccus sp. NFK12]|uniref:Pyrroline-5-carboxylate reductase n=1 Tax=Pelagicoccus enzymogenes TaxID=2773457 RepID=A0A927F4U9_9BACT|nr:pyrroline-5-carboxylate reductase [Pelagicoccus enzymogenes]MBD5778418.1 pyrroline-5-carboxylate reductase [Pelagicoccus enzymogenes]MDQ8197221.1 pyrroline-5-carboxylate reductase [Pelagicoccus enzymogenes]
MKIGFIGAGNMGRAIANGLVAKGVCKADALQCISASGKGSAIMAEQTGARIAASKKELIEQSDVVVLAFKPQHLETITDEEAKAATGKLVVSVLAGRTLASMKAVFPEASNLVRVMPNTPSQIGKGVSTYCFEQTPSDSQQAEVNELLASLGTAYEVAEDQLHVATVINGCGPAFYFRIGQLISEAADARGLDKDLALKLAAETGIGSLELMKASKRDPKDLIDEVVSPNGVTHALLTSLDRQGFPKIIDQSMQDAVDRSIELSQSK